MIKNNIKIWNPSIGTKTMLGMREINDNVLLSTDADPQEEDAEKSLDFDAVSYNPHVCITNSWVYDLLIAYILVFWGVISCCVKWLVVKLVV